MKKWNLFLALSILLIARCAGDKSEVITSEPFGADIYWGRTQTDLESSGHVTTYSGNLPRPRKGSWCYQVKKKGYHDSEIVCRKKENYRYIDFHLTPIKTVITSEPPFATIYWGPFRDQLKETIHRTPRTEENVRIGANWKEWCFQVKKEGYYDSEIVCVPQTSEDRQVHFDLKPLAGNKSVSSSRVTLSWEDQSSNELGISVNPYTFLLA